MKDVMARTPWKTRHTPAGASLDGIRLALQAIREATDLGAVFNQVCVGAARVSSAKETVLAFERPDGFEVAAAVGRSGKTAVQARVRQLHLSGDLSGVDVGEADGYLVVPVPTAIGIAVILAERGEPEDRAALELFAQTAGALIDLHVFRDQAAIASHRVQPKERKAGILGSLAPGDAVVVLNLDDLDGTRHRSGQIAVDSVVSALGVHLLNGTRPPGDAVALLHEGTFLVVLRDLKAPVEAIAQRLQATWNAATPTTTFCLGAALHLDGTPPLETFEKAQDALASATRSGGGQAHVAPSIRTA